MWQIIKNEWSALGRNKVLLGISLGFLAVLLISVYMGNVQTDHQQARYEEAKQEVRKLWEEIDAMNPHGAAHYGTYVFKPSNMLSSLDEGVNSVTGNVIRVEGHVQNEIVYSEASQMQVVSKFGKLKSSLLLQYILPLLLLFLSFHSVSSERQSGRYKLLVLQGASPTSIVWSKALAIWLFGLVILSITMLIYLLLNVSSIDGDILSRSLYFYISYALYYFIIVCLTVLFSARWQNSTIALTSMLGIWILWTIFLPNIILSTVENSYPLPSRNEFKSSMREDRSKGIDGHNPRDERGKELEADILKEYGVSSVEELPINFDGIRMQADEEYGNKVWDKHFGNLRNVMAQQKRRYQLAGIIDPFISLQNASMGFAASDNLHHEEFLIQVENYRRSFIKMLNDKHAFGGSKSGDWGWTADQDFYRSVPDYEYQPIALKSVMNNYWIDLLYILAWSVFVGLLLTFVSKKMEVV